MDSLDKSIKDFLSKESAKLNGVSRRRDLAPTVDDFYAFLMDDMEGEALESMLRHLKSHPEDRELVAKARGLMEDVESSEKEQVPEKLKAKVKNMVRAAGKLNCPHCGKLITWILVQTRRYFIPVPRPRHQGTAFGSGVNSFPVIIPESGVGSARV